MPKNKRVREACDICRKRKTGCDGKDPCSFCLERQLECTFDYRPNRKRASKQEVRQLSEQLFLARNLLYSSKVSDNYNDADGVNSSIPEAFSELSNHASTSQDVPLWPGIQAISSQKQDVVFFPLQNETFIGNKEVDEPAIDKHNFLENTVQKEEEVCQLFQRNAHPRTSNLSVGRTSVIYDGFSYILQQKELLRSRKEFETKRDMSPSTFERSSTKINNNAVPYNPDVVPSSKILEHLEKTRENDVSLSIKHPYDTTRVHYNPRLPVNIREQLAWPDKSREANLIQTYFEWVHPSFPVIHRATLERQCLASLDSESDLWNDAVWLSCMLGIFALAAQYIPEERTYRRHWWISRDRLNANSATHCHSFGAIQNLLISAHLAHSIMIDPSSRTLSSDLAIRTMIDLGCHKEIDVNQALRSDTGPSQKSKDRKTYTEEELQISFVRLVWWAATIQHLDSCRTLGRLPGFNFEESTTRLPSWERIKLLGASRSFSFICCITYVSQDFDRQVSLAEDHDGTQINTKLRDVLRRSMKELDDIAQTISKFGLGLVEFSEKVADGERSFFVQKCELHLSLHAVNVHFCRTWLRRRHDRHQDLSSYDKIILERVKAMFRSIDHICSLILHWDLQGMYPIFFARSVFSPLLIPTINLSSSPPPFDRESTCLHDRKSFRNRGYILDHARILDTRQRNRTR